MVPGRTPSACSRCATFTVMSAWRAIAAAGPLALEPALEAIDERAAADYVDAAVSVGR